MILNQQLELTLADPPSYVYRAKFFICQCIACHKLIGTVTRYRAHISKCKKLEMWKTGIKIMSSTNVSHRCLICNRIMSYQRRIEQKSCRVVCNPCREFTMIRTNAPHPPYGKTVRNANGKLMYICLTCNKRMSNSPPPECSSVRHKELYQQKIQCVILKYRRTKNAQRMQK